MQRVEKGRQVDIKVESAYKGTALPVVHLGGEIDLHTCPEFRAVLQKLIDENQAQIILDMEEVPYVDSAALGVLVDTQRRLKERNGMLHLAAVTPFVMRAFEITRLIRIFHVHATLADAIEAASAPPAAATG